MSTRLMILPSPVFENIRLLSVPEDFEEHEVYRHVTGIIARTQEAQPGCAWETLAEALEDHGFSVVPYILGPALPGQEPGVGS